MGAPKYPTQPLSSIFIYIISLLISLRVNYRHSQLAFIGLVKFCLVRVSKGTREEIWVAVELDRSSYIVIYFLTPWKGGFWWFLVVVYAGDVWESKSFIASFNKLYRAVTPHPPTHVIQIWSCKQFAQRPLPNIYYWLLPP